MTGIAYGLTDAAGSLLALAEALKASQDANAELAQAAWDAYGILGFDQDGDKTPAAMTHPPMPDFIRAFAGDARADYDEACDEAEQLREKNAELERLLEQARRIAAHLEGENAEQATRIREARKLAAFLPIGIIAEIVTVLDGGPS